MKPSLRILFIGLTLTLFCPRAQADETQGGDKEIPTEISEPPYEIGDLVSEQGYYVDRGEGEARLNLRFENNKLRLYWIDGNGLIAEPEFQTARVRLRGSVGGRAYQFLEMLPSGAGLGAEGAVIPPHIYMVILTLLPEDEDAEPTFYNFRYTAELDGRVDPTEKSDT